MPRRISKDDLKGVTKSQVSNLKFLDRFIKTMNWTKPQFAEKIGYHVEFSMEMPKSNDDEIINIELDEKDIVTDSPKRNLDFLRRALYDNDIDQHVLAKKLKIDVETIDYWFRHDKCYISYFFLIAKYTGMKLKIDIKPNK